ncbi:MAG: hypothetical protein ACQER9_01935 [Nanobdellota archaeon]
MTSFFTETIIIFVSYLGIFIGSLLSFISPEELYKGKKYFYWIRKIILAITFFILIDIIITDINPVFSVIFASIISLLSLKVRFYDQLVFFLYPLLSFIIGFLETSVIFFLYTIIFGTIIASDYSKKDSRKLQADKKKILIKTIKKSSLFFISFILILIIKIIML